MRACHFFLLREGVLGIGHPVVFLFHQCITFCNKCKLYNKWHKCNLCGSLGSRYFLYVMNERTTHRERAHLNVPGWSLVWNELPTKKLSVFSFVTFEWNKWRLRKDSTNFWIVLKLFNPLTPMSDHNRFSPYNINTISTR